MPIALLPWKSMRVHVIPDEIYKFGRLRIYKNFYRFKKNFFMHYVIMHLKNKKSKETRKETILIYP